AFGPTRAEAWLSHPDRRGTLGGLLGPVLDSGIGKRLGRLATRLVLGAAPRPRLRSWARPTFRDLARTHARAPDAASSQAALFGRCEVEYQEPEVGMDAVEALEALGTATKVPTQVCCGLPWLEIGDRSGAAAQAERNVQWMAQAVAQGMPVLVLSSSCAAMLRSEAPRLLRTEAAATVARAVQELTPYLLERLPPEPEGPARRRPIDCILGCHAKDNGLVRLVHRVSGVQPQVVGQCSGFHDCAGLSHQPPELQVSR